MEEPMSFGLLIFIALILLTAGCASTPAVVCTEENAASDACKQQKYYYRDEIEPDRASGGGDRPAIAGCHVRYSDANCTKDRVVYFGDQCIGSGDNVKLMEWTNGECHEASTTVIDRKPYDCNAWCMDRGHAAGDCTQTVADVCGTRASAYCKCTGPTRPTGIEK